MNIKDKPSSPSVVIDPRDIDTLVQNVGQKSLTKYKSTWMEFVRFSGISNEKKPTETDFYNFLHKKYVGKCTGNSIKNVYWHLNKFYKELYNGQLADFPNLHSFVEKCLAKNNSTRKESAFTKSEINRFLREAQDENRYWLLRKVVACLAYSCGTKLSELHGLSRKSVQLCPDGYVVNFPPTVKRARSSFLIPKREVDGVCFATIIENYINALKADVVIQLENDPFLVTGRAPGKCVSRFFNHPLSIGMLRDIGKDIASFLGLEYPAFYTGDCIGKLTSGEQMKTLTLDFKEDNGTKRRNSEQQNDSNPNKRPSLDQDCTKCVQYKRENEELLLKEKRYTDEIEQLKNEVTSLRGQLQIAQCKRIQANELPTLQVKTEPKDETDQIEIKQEPVDPLQL